MGTDRLDLDTYVVDTLMPDLVGHDRRPAAFLVYLFLWRQTDGGRKARKAISLRQIAEGTGRSKRSVQSAIHWLRNRQLIEVRRASITAVPEYSIFRPWADGR